MEIQETPLPPEIEAAILELAQIAEYLELEEGGFSPKEIKYRSYLTVHDSIAFVVFDYITEEGLHLAFLQYSPARGVEESGCIGCWPRTQGETIVWSIAEYLEMNPIRHE